MVLVQNSVFQQLSIPQIESSSAFAPSNIALVKYWGKRCQRLNLPLNSSLSISLGEYGAHTTVSVNNMSCDRVFCNGELSPITSEFHQRVVNFLNLFKRCEHLDVATTINIPVAAGLASSAAGFAALTKALNELYCWELDVIELSKIARLGSGSAARSIENGFVVWESGSCVDGTDSYAQKIPLEWPELRVGLLVVDHSVKPLSSRKAMQRCVETSPFMDSWVKLCNSSIEPMLDYIATRDFHGFATTAEHIAMTMHGLMLSAKPSIMYMTKETLAAMSRLKHLRQEGVEVYFTEDAGPNLKLLFLATDTEIVKATFPEIQVVNPWNK